MPSRYEGGYSRKPVRAFHSTAVRRRDRVMSAARRVRRVVRPYTGHAGPGSRPWCFPSLPACWSTGVSVVSVNGTSPPRWMSSVRWCTTHHAAPAPPATSTVAASELRAHVLRRIPAR